MQRVSAFLVFSSLYKDGSLRRPVILTHHDDWPHLDSIFIHSLGLTLDDALPHHEY